MKKGLVFVMLFGLVMSGLVFVVALNEGFGTKVLTPLNGNNFSSNNFTDTHVLFNASFLNASDIYDPVNATFYVNISASAWLMLGNSTHCVNGGGLGGGSFCAGVLNVSSLYNGTLLSDGYYTINVTFSNHSGVGFEVATNTSNMTTIIIDNTEPRTVVFQGGLASGNNHSDDANSGNLTLNVSADDALANISVVQFLVFNKTGGINGTYTAVKEGTTTYWSTSINTSHYVDGNYNITVFVNDTAGNFNKTANGTTYSASSIILDTVFDNSGPIVAVSCSPKTVFAGDGITCTCSASDAESGINSTSNPAPSTVNTGTYEHTCTSVNGAGVSASGKDTYIVEQGGSGGGGGGGGGGSSSGSEEEIIVEEGDDEFQEVEWRDTIDQDDVDLSEKGLVSQPLGEEERVSLMVSGERHHIGIVSIKARSVLIQVASSPVQVEISIGETKKFDLNDDGYYDLKVTLDSIELAKANLEIEYLQEEISPTEESGSLAWLWLLIAILVVAAIVYFLVIKKK